MIKTALSIGSDTPSTSVSFHREFIADAAYRASVYAGHAIECAQIGDDRGLTRAIRMLAICAVNAAEDLPGLAEAVETDKRLRNGIRAAYPPKSSPRAAERTGAPAVGSRDGVA